MSEIGSCSRWAYEGEVEQWAKEEVERELAEMTVSLEQLGWAGREGEGGERVFGSWLRDLFTRVLVARVLFIEGESAEFVLQWWWKGWRWVVDG